MNPEQLRLMIDWFENKVEKVEKEYKEKHREEFNIQKMNRYVNRKLRIERENLIKMNLFPSALILKTTESFKY